MFPDISQPKGRRAGGAAMRWGKVIRSWAHRKVAKHCVKSLLVLGLTATSSSQAGEVKDVFFGGHKSAFSQDRLWVWAAGAALTALALNYDRDVYDHHIREEDWQPANFVGDNMGTGIPGAIVAITELALRRPAGKAHAGALVSAFFWTTGLKGAIGRDRPPAFAGNSGRFNSSFPSGHTSTSFATCGALWGSYGAKVGVPVCMLAAMSGYSRMQHGVHYLSDVIFGATLGLSFGLGFADYVARTSSTSSALRPQILPYVSSLKDFGVVASWSWN